MPTKLYLNTKGKFKKSINKAPAGLWKSITTTDLNKDKKNILLGNLGTNTKFYRDNSQSLRMYLKDFESK